MDQLSTDRPDTNAGAMKEAYTAGSTGQLADYLEGLQRPVDEQRLKRDKDKAEAWNEAVQRCAAIVRQTTIA